MADSPFSRFLRFSIELGFPDSPAKTITRAEKLLKKAFRAQSCTITPGSACRKTRGNGNDLICVPLRSGAGRVGTCELRGTRGHAARNMDLLGKLCGEVAARLSLAVRVEKLGTGSENVIKSFSAGLDFYDRFTEKHSEAVKEYSEAIAEELGLPRKKIRELARASYLHDIGKVGISPGIINKKRKLTRKDWVEIKKHPLVAKEILERTESLRYLVPAVVYHHERYDGRGYPCGLKKDKIPVPARILAAADSYATMLANRPYRRAMTFGTAVRTLIRASGTQFDPWVVKALLKVLRKRVS